MVAFAAMAILLAMISSDGGNLSGEDATDPNSLPDTMDIIGEVVSGTPSYSVANAEVTAVGSDGISYKTFTGSNGIFRILNVPVDTYSISTVCVGYEDNTSTFPSTGTVMRVVLVPAEIILTGYICDTDGLPLGGVDIVVNGMYSTESGSNGKFSITFTKSKNDTVTFSSEGYSIISGGFNDVLVKSGDKYILNTDKALRAGNGYTLTASDSLNPIMMKLIMTEYHGHVMSKDGTKSYALSGVTVELVSGDDTYSCITNDSGLYSILCPSANAYVMHLSKNGYEDKTINSPTNPLDVYMDPANVTVYGISMGYDDSGNLVPLAGVSVEINGEHVGYSDANGVFTPTFRFKVNNTIVLELMGYKTNISGLNGVITDDNGVCHIHLEYAEKDSSGRYIIANDSHPFILARTNVVFTGIVSSNINGVNEPLNNAQVSLVSEEGTRYYTHTNEFGMYSIVCGYGNYNLYVECNGFLDFGPMTISAQQTVNNVEMEPYDSSLIFGLGLPHSMMVMGLIVLGLVSLAAVTVFVLSRKGIADISTENDLEEDTEE